MGPKHGKPLTEGHLNGDHDYLDFNNIDAILSMLDKGERIVYT